MTSQVHRCSPTSFPDRIVFRVWRSIPSDTGQQQVMCCEVLVPLQLMDRFGIISITWGEREGVSCRGCPSDFADFPMPIPPSHISAPIYLSICLSFVLSFLLSTYRRRSIYSSVFRSFVLSVFLSIYPSTCLHLNTTSSRLFVLSMLAATAASLRAFRATLTALAQIRQLSLRQEQLPELNIMRMADCFPWGTFSISPSTSLFARCTTMFVTSWRKVGSEEGRKDGNMRGMTGAGKKRQTGHSTDEACRGRQEENRGMRKGYLFSATREVPPVIWQWERQQLQVPL